MKAKSSLKTLLQKRILEIQGVEYKKSRFGSISAFYIGKKEFAHFHEGTEIDIRVTKPFIKKIKTQYQDDERFHWRYSSSDWVEFQFPKKQDLKMAVELARIAVEANKG